MKTALFSAILFLGLSHAFGTCSISINSTGEFSFNLIIDDINKQFCQIMIADSNSYVPIDLNNIKVVEFDYSKRRLILDINYKDQVIKLRITPFKRKLYSNNKAYNVLPIVWEC